MDELIARLEAAPGPDAGIDMALWWLSLHEDTRQSFGRFVNEQVAKHGTDHLAQFYDSSKPHCIANLSTREKFTADLNAALSLVGRLLPDLQPLVGVDRSVGFDNDIPGSEETPRWNAWCYGESGEHPTSPAIALCLAVLRAKQSQTAQATKQDRSPEDV